MIINVQYLEVELWISYCADVSKVIFAFEVVYVSSILDRDELAAGYAWLTSVAPALALATSY